jgi:hypothetical protein
MERIFQALLWQEMEQKIQVLVAVAVLGERLAHLQVVMEVKVS